MEPWGQYPRKWKVLKHSKSVVRLSQSIFELLLEPPIFLFQFFDATVVFCKDHEVLTASVESCSTGCVSILKELTRVAWKAGTTTWLKRLSASDTNQCSKRPF